MKKVAVIGIIAFPNATLFTKRVCCNAKLPTVVNLNYINTHLTSSLNFTQHKRLANRHILTAVTPGV